MFVPLFITCYFQSSYCFPRVQCTPPLTCTNQGFQVKLLFLDALQRTENVVSKAMDSGHWTVNIRNWRHNLWALGRRLAGTRRNRSNVFKSWRHLRILTVYCFRDDISRPLECIESKQPYKTTLVQTNLNTHKSRYYV